MQKNKKSPKVTAKPFDWNEHSSEELEQIGKTLGAKVGLEGDKVAKKINKILDKYGLQAKVLVQLINKDSGEIFDKQG